MARKRFNAMLNCTVRPDIRRRVEEIANARETTISEVVRELLTKALENPHDAIQ